MNSAQFGILCSVIAAVGYTVANGFLRAVSECDPAWVTAVKSSWTLIFFVPYFLVLLSRGNSQFVNSKALWFLVFASFIGQFGGNLCFQWSLKYIGVCFVIPLCLAAMILTGAIVAKIFLKEHVKRSEIVSMIVLVLAVVILNVGSWQARIAEPATAATLSEVAEAQFMYKLLAGLAASFSGFSYAILGVSIRYFMRDEVSVATPLVVVSLVGFFGTGLVGFASLGWDGIMAIPQHQFLMMCCAGIANALAFLALTKALENSSIVSVNMVNSSQVAMGAIMGIVFFHEPITLFLVIGCLMTMLGFLIRDTQRPGLELEKQIFENAEDPPNTAESVCQAGEPLQSLVASTAFRESNQQR